MLTVQEVADLLKVCPRTVSNMAKKGEIPASKIGHLWRFDEESILQWLRRKSENGGNGSSKSAKQNLNGPIMNLITPDQVRVEKSAMEKREILEDLASLAIRTGLITDYPTLVHSLEEREKMYSTAVNNGVAFPHPRRPIHGLHNPILSVLLLKEGVDFGAPDGGLTHLFVLFCAPDDVSHVRILARLAQVFHRRAKLLSSLKRVSSPEKIVEYLIRAEQEELKERNLNN